MDSHTSRSSKSASLAALLLMSLCGCVFDPVEQVGPPKPPPEPKPFTSIQNTMDNFVMAHEEQDIELYRACLASEYQFFLDPDEADQVGVDYYSKEEDVAQMEAIFNSPNLVDIRFKAIPHAQVDQCWDAGDCVSSVDASWAEISYTIEIEIEYVGAVERACGSAVISFTLQDLAAIGIVRILDFTGQSAC